MKIKVDSIHFTSDNMVKIKLENKYTFRISTHEFSSWAYGISRETDFGDRHYKVKPLFNSDHLFGAVEFIERKEDEHDKRSDKT